jgi:hypothetical protein
MLHQEDAEIFARLNGKVVALTLTRAAFDAAAAVSSRGRSRSASAP